MRNGTGRGYGSTPGATSHEQAIIARLSEAERRIGDGWCLSALGDGLDLIRELIAQRGRLQDHAEQREAAGADHADWCPPCPEFEPDPPSPDF